LEEESRSHLIAAEQEIDELRGQLADSLEIQKRLKESLTLEENAHASERRQLVEQCESLERSKDSLLRSIQGLDEQLALKESEIEATRLQGTPRGDTAKIVLQKTFEKVKCLKTTIETLTRECGQKDDLIAALRLEIEQIPILQADSRKMQSDLKELAEDNNRSQIELELRQSKIVDLENEISELRESLKTQTQSKDRLAEEMKDKVSLLEEELIKQKDLSKDLQSKKSEAEQRAKALLDSLDETKRVLVAMRHSEDSNSEVMQLSFLKIKNLEGELAMQQLEVDNLSNQLNEASMAEENLQSMLSDAEEKHAADLEAMGQTIHSLEGNVSRLRMELLDEVSKSDQLKEELRSVKSTNAVYLSTISELEGSLEDMRSSIHHVEDKLKEKQSALSIVEAAKDSMLVDMTEKISDAVKQRDIAQESFDKATEEVSKITENLHIAKSQLQAYERSMTAKETTIISQKAIISELECKTKDLTSDLEKSKLDIIKRDEKLKHLGQAKIQAEIQLAEDIQVSACNIL
jgi:chromosome segregation ATPase